MSWAGVMVSPADCAEHLVYALLRKDLKQYNAGGASFVDNRGDPVKGKIVASEEQRKRVWEHTQELLQAGI